MRLRCKMKDDIPGRQGFRRCIAFLRRTQPRSSADSSSRMRLFRSLSGSFPPGDRASRPAAVLLVAITTGLASAGPAPAGHRSEASHRGCIGYIGYCDAAGEARRARTGDDPSGRAATPANAGAGSGAPVVARFVEPMPENHDGETAFSVRLEFSEDIVTEEEAMRDAAFSVSGGDMIEAFRVAGRSDLWELTVAPASDRRVMLSAASVRSCAEAAALCTEDGRSLSHWLAATVAGPAPGPRIAGVPQVGSTLEASFFEAPGGNLTWRWLRGTEPIADAAGRTYAPTTADVGARISTRVEHGGQSVEGAATAPVWPAPSNPPLAAGEEELLSTTMTLGSSVANPFYVAGYLRLPGASFGSMEAAEFRMDGVKRTLRMFLLNDAGLFALSIEPPLENAEGLVAWWDGYRIAGFVPEITHGIQLWVSRTVQPESQYTRYWRGRSNGVRVAVSLRRAVSAAGATGR